MGGDQFVCFFGFFGVFFKSSQVPAVMRTAEVGWGRTHAAAPRTPHTHSHIHHFHWTLAQRRSATTTLTYLLVTDCRNF